ncbi:unnamed protein product [Cuscuta epithymum]|uniref:Transposase n=1 Tax=Cuscuta epithymum TaxID=186058 RepID=A0AAV0EYL7_9ASTE|nr:unnamed protein product [Cuscuta epithymum]
MSSTCPSKEWMDADTLSEKYLLGVASFLQFTKQKLGGDDWYCCPCKKCLNKKKNNLNVISEHLVSEGIDLSYRTWFNHGEPLRRSRPNVRTPISSSPSSNHNKGSSPRISDLFWETLGRVEPNDIDACLNDPIQENDTILPDGLLDSPVDANYERKLEDAMKPLYPSCEGQHTKLSATIELLSMKARYNCPEALFTQLFQFIKNILPKENNLPESLYCAKEMVKPFRMSYDIIDACPNDCILYWRENADKESCPKCNENRWKSVESTKAIGKRLPQKKLRYFPIKERLKRLYNVPWIAENMIWHDNSIVSDTSMGHPKDSTFWVNMNKEWPEFASEKRNVRLGLATDGFNPFGMSNSYSCWPVMVVLYNLPPSLCMTKEFTLLTMLILGPHGPGHNIDVYLQPLIAELSDLWSGCVIYDSYTKTNFTMKAMLMWCIHDFPAYAHLSGCRTAGRYGCPVCGEGTDATWLKHGKKFAYLGHRRFLPESHPFRSQKTQFNGNEEHRKAPKRLTGSDILRKMETIHTEFGKVTGQKRKRATKVNSECSKRSIFFNLPYWKVLPLRHNVDVMHVEKNIAENFFATTMDTKGKSKDHLQARKDLKAMNIKRKLWPTEENEKKTYPKASFSLSLLEKELICKTLSKLKVPIGYSGNWKHKVCLQDFQLKGLKSHDYHILIQGLLPVFLMYGFKKEKPLQAAIRQLGNFFKVLCSKVINRAELSHMQKCIVETLCVFETYFPPSFFVSMTHVVIHLAEEAQLCGPVRYRWMYQFERMMRTYKRYGRNKTFLEGSIAEQYILEEAMRHCMEYIPNDKGKSYNRVGRTYIENEDECPYPFNANGKAYRLSGLQYEQARKWVLKQSPVNAEWEEKYHAYLQDHKFTARRVKGTQQKLKTLNYIPWLRKQLEKEEMTHFKRLVNGPDFDALAYKAYAVNGYIFYTADAELNSSTQNSGVSMNAVTSFRSSAKDKNLVEEEVTYYGIVKQILELNYYDFRQSVFYCDWVRIEDKVNGCVVDPETNLIFVNFGRFRRNSSDDDEPFIHASEATQVFYCKDETRDDWHLVLESPKRLSHDVDAYQDPFTFEETTFNSSLSTSMLAGNLEHDKD